MCNDHISQEPFCVVSSPKVFLAVVATCSLAAVTPRIAAAQHITIDGRFAPAQTLVGPNYAIGANLGKQVGSNLFHSFGQFGLAAGESATFSGPGTINNVIGRVTGGTVSSINGTIGSTITGANLYLINPSGIVFGPNAMVNVSGSFHASSADYIKMSDGARFQATNPDGSTLSAAPPAAFGFLNATPGRITVNGSVLGVGSGQTLGLIGGPVLINRGALSAPADTIRITSVAGPGEVPAAKGTGSKPTVTGYGPVIIDNGSAIGSHDFTSSNPSDLPVEAGSSVAIRAGRLTIVNSLIATGGTEKSGNSGSVSVRVAGPLSVDGGGISSSLTAETLSPPSPGTPPPINIGQTTVTPGNITVKAGTLSVANGGMISASTFGPSHGGNVTVTVSGALTLSDPGTGIVALATPTASGDAGSVMVEGRQIAITRGAEIASTTAGSGNGGSVQVTAHGVLSLSDPGSGIIASAAAGASGNAGSITVNASQVTLTTGAEIASTTAGTGAGGSVNVLTPGPLVLDGEAQITASAKGLQSGPGGSVMVNANSLTVSGGAQIASTTAGPGKGGDVDVTVANGVILSGTGPNDASGITTSAQSGSRGPAGEVVLTVGGAIALSGGAIVTSSTAGSGNGGTSARKDRSV
jgi:filamentous hemagglutinin family protein